MFKTFRNVVSAFRVLSNYYYIKKYARVFKITAEQMQLIYNYMEGSGYRLVIIGKELYRIDLCDNNQETVQYSIKNAITTILEWQDDFSQRTADCDMNDYLLSDVRDEATFNAWRGGTYGTYTEREDIRKELLQLKRDEEALLSAWESVLVNDYHIDVNVPKKPAKKRKACLQ